jgi:hypothetical protein
MNAGSSELIRDFLDGSERFLNSSEFEDYFVIAKAADKEHEITKEFMIINPSQQYVSELNKETINND